MRYPIRNVPYSGGLGQEEFNKYIKDETFMYAHHLVVVARTGTYELDSHRIRMLNNGQFSFNMAQSILPIEILTACEAWVKNRVDMPIVDYLNTMFNED
jgi:hypothetical protein